MKPKIFLLIIFFLLPLPLHGKNEAQPIPIIIDSDPGMGITKWGRPRDVDDSLILVEAINSEKIDLRGITIVSGNSKAHQGLKIAKELLARKESSVPLFKGTSRPRNTLAKPSVNAAVAFMHRLLSKEKLTLVAVGPLTNIANLLRNFPEIKENIVQIIAVMGRSPGKKFYMGDKGPLRDFNYVKDPLSAKVVIQSGIPIVLMPFELSVQAAITPQDLEAVRNKGTSLSAFLAREAKAWQEHFMKTFPSEKGFHPWDSAALHYLISPEWFVCEARGFNFRKITDADKTAAERKKESRLNSKTTSLFELDASYPGQKVTFCHDWQPGKQQEFVKKIVSLIY